MTSLPAKKQLHLTFGGRIIDHLGIQMYQSPVAAIAEIVSNGWDANAERIDITLPENLNQDAEIIIKDTGYGMTFDECQNAYLNVGRDRRGNNLAEKTVGKNRPVLGRKGIGKFAGFGIAEIIQIETVSGNTGEKTVFVMDINNLRSDTYAAKDTPIDVTDYLEADATRTNEHGTMIRLKKLKLKKLISPVGFRKSMARRFLMHENAVDFKLYVNGQELPQSEELAGVEFVFPRDYTAAEKPSGLQIEGDWGKEVLTNGQPIKWKFSFYAEPIKDEELTGVAIFSDKKLVQVPFFFNLSGGLGGQHGQEYLSGQVQADYMNGLKEDVIATERQRVNWDHIDTIPLLEWGKERVKELLRIWQSRRNEDKLRLIDEKIQGFSVRLDKLPRHERETVKKAIERVAGITSITKQQFIELGGAILSSWEKGRLHELISDLSAAGEMTEGQFLSMLVESDVLSALNVAEAIRTKLDAIKGLKKRINTRVLENDIRDYIADKPWLLDPKWETFKKETRVKSILDDAAQKAGLNEAEYKGRIDLALSSGTQLLVVEFMRPGLPLDENHLNRCVKYVDIIRNNVAAQSQLEIKDIQGLIIADSLDKNPILIRQLDRIQKDAIRAVEWQTMLATAESEWQEFLDILVDRSPKDERIQALRMVEKA